MTSVDCNGAGAGNRGGLLHVVKVDVVICTVTIWRIKDCRETRIIVCWIMMVMMMWPSKCM